MDLNEHTLNEAQRTLKRLGITHFLRSPLATKNHILAPSLHTESSQQAGFHDHGSSGPPASLTANETLPPVLRSLFHGKHAPMRTMWTYAGLYEDMKRTETPARLAVFKKIQESVCLHLKWTASDISAWPLDVNPQIFDQGIAYYRPRTVIFFRDNAPETGTTAEPVHPLLMHAGCRVFTLPNLEEMAQGNQQLKNEAWKILQTVPE